MRRYIGALVMVALAPGSADAQSINVSFGHASGGPSPSYAAAGASGVWNSITGVAGGVYNLVAADGSASGVSVSQSPTTTVLTTTDPSVSGDDAKLLNSGLVTTGAETCLSFHRFAPGTYEVLIYAWLPNQPTVKSRTRQDQAASTIDVGGAWSGTHAQGVTYARYVVTVDSSGELPAHSGLVPGAPQSALNAVQIRPLSSAQPDAGMMPDASTMPGLDASVISGPDSGSAPSDASMSGGGGGGASNHSRHGGCSTSGAASDASPFAIVLLAVSFALLWRYRRSRK
jgi:MYXO-CTERM domain-containing protein